MEKSCIKNRDKVFIKVTDLHESQKGLHGKWSASASIQHAGYGSFNNYLFCEEHGMEKFRKSSIIEMMMLGFYLFKGIFLQPLKLCYYEIRHID